MDFKIGQIVTINKEIATEDFLYDCYFSNPSLKRAEILQDVRHTITGIGTEVLRSGKRVKVARLRKTDSGTCWIPLIALVDFSKNYLPALTPGRILKTREGVYYIIANKENAFVIHLLMGGKESLSNWDVCTGKHCSRKDFDIVAVYNSDNMCGFKGLATATPIWTETTPAREMTVAEIEKELGHGIKVVGENGKEWEF